MDCECAFPHSHPFERYGLWLRLNLQAPPGAEPYPDPQLKEPELAPQSDSNQLQLAPLLNPLLPSEAGSLDNRISTSKPLVFKVTLQNLPGTTSPLKTSLNPSAEMPFFKTLFNMVFSVIQSPIDSPFLPPLPEPYGSKPSSPTWAGLSASSWRRRRTLSTLPKSTRTPLWVGYEILRGKRPCGRDCKNV